MKEERDQNRVVLGSTLGAYYGMAIVVIIMSITTYMLLYFGEIEHARGAVFGTVGAVVANILFQRHLLRWLNDADE